MAANTPNPVLSKEVLAPQTPYSGLGVVLVASLAMFLAMASSAFIVRARMVQENCPLRAKYQQEMPAAVDWNHNGNHDCVTTVQGPGGTIFLKLSPDCGTSSLEEFVHTHPAPVPQLKLVTK